MNKKKILACGISAVMLFSSVVANAELTVSYNDEFATYLIDTLPTKAEIAERAPHVNVVANKIDVSESGFNAMIQKAITNAGQECYKLTYTVSDLGGLFNGFDAEMNGKLCALNGVTVKLGNSIGNSIARYTTGTTIPNMTFGVSVDTNTKQFVANLYAADATKPYPETGELGTYLDNASVSFDCVVVVAGGTVLSVDSSRIDSAITYAVGDMGFASQYNPGTISADNFTLGTTTPDPTYMDMTASLKGKYENGYVWEATVTPGDNALTQFNAKFTEAGTGKTAERTVHNVGAMDFSGTGSLTFNVGLRTQKTLSGAEFTAYATADDYKTVAAPVE